jgi:hypothetical protein
MTVLRGISTCKIPTFSEFHDGASPVFGLTGLFRFDFIDSPISRRES